MARATKIEWCDHTFNPWWGCAKVSAGCENCYAERWAHRWGGKWGQTTERIIKDNWDQPLKWNRAAAYAGVRRRVFSLSMGDWLEDKPDLVEPLARLLTTIDETPNLDWLLVTKRPENWPARMDAVIKFGLVNMRRPGPCKAGQKAAGWLLNNQAPPNVWVLASVENQEMANRRIPDLLRIPARVHGLSCEPLLSAIDLTKIPWGGGYLDAFYCDYHDGTGNIIAGPPSGWHPLRWVIIGPETGSRARPMDPAWAQSLIQQCRVACVPVFVKGLTAQEFPKEFPT